MTLPVIPMIRRQAASLGAAEALASIEMVRKCRALPGERNLSDAERLELLELERELRKAKR